VEPMDAKGIEGLAGNSLIKDPAIASRHSTQSDVNISGKHP